MTEIVLYTHEKEKFNPLSKACSDISSCYGFNLEKVNAPHSWTSIGDLPILRVNSFLFTSDQFLAVLQHLYGIDSDIPQEGLNFFSMLEEICCSRLHQGTLFAIHNPSEPAKVFSSKIHKIKSLAKSIIFASSKIKKFHTFGNRNIRTSQQAFELVEDSHKLLSEVLEDYSFFSSKFTRTKRPRTVDFIVYAYLKEELVYLSGHPHVKDSFDKYQNLIDFMENMTLAIEKGVAGGSKEKKKIEISKSNANFLKSRAIKIGNFIEDVKKDEHANGRRKFVTACALFFFGYLLVNNE